MDRITLSTGTASRGEGLTHLVALEERGMTGLAEHLLSEKRSVSGSLESDRSPDERLLRKGLRLHRGHAPSAVPHLADRLVYPPGTGPTHPERLTALRRGLAQQSLASALEEILTGARGISVLGRRVSRVASHLIGWILTRAGMDPTLVVDDVGRTASGSSSPSSVALVDVPGALVDAGTIPAAGEMAVLLDLGSVSPESMVGLTRLAESLPSTGLMLGYAGDACFEQVAARTSARVGRLSLDAAPAIDWWGADLKSDRGRYRFRVFHHGEFVLECRPARPGMRYVEGALAAIAVCRSLDVATSVIREAIEEFRGSARSFDHLGTYRGVTLIDDDAIEPSDVAETLELARMVYGRRRLWAVYAPSRGDALPLSCLAPADRVLWLGHGGIADSDLPKRASESPDWLRQAADHEEALWNLDRHLEPGDVLVTLGSGETGTIADAFIRRLPRDRQGR